jgi:hypothetical protein
LLPYFAVLFFLSYFSFQTFILALSRVGCFHFILFLRLFCFIFTCTTVFAIFSLALSFQYINVLLFSINSSVFWDITLRN